MIEIKNLVKSYKSGDDLVEVLREVNVDFKKGEFVSIYGPSGSGKSTLMNLIGGLDRSDKGEIIIEGKSISDYSDKELDHYRNKKVGFVFQHFNLLSHLSALQNVELSLKLAGYNYFTRRKRAKELLSIVGLKQLMHKKPTKLSGGEQQRVAIARALANDPDIILADEPTGALDSKTSQDILELLKSISNSGKLVIVVTHDDNVAKWSNRIVNINDGKVVSVKENIDEKTTDKELESNFKKNKLRFSFKISVLIAFNNIIRKLLRSIMLSFATSLSLTVVIITLVFNFSVISNVRGSGEELTRIPNLLHVLMIDNSVSTGIDTEALKEQNLEQLELFKDINNVDDVYNIYVEQHAFLEADYDGEFYDVGKTITIKPYIEQFKPAIAYGKLPENDDEILLSRDALKSLFSLSVYDERTEAKLDNLFGTKIKVRYTDKYQRHEVRLLLREDPNFSFDDRVIEKEYTFVGVTERSRANTLVMVPYEDLISINEMEYLGKDLETKQIDVYNSTYPEYYFFASNYDFETLSSIKDDIIKVNPNLVVENDSLKFSKVLILLENISYGFLGFVILTVIITVLMVGITQYVSVLSRKTEIGVLRALGASKKDVRNIFSLEVLAISIASSILAIFQSAFLIRFLSKTLVSLFKELGFTSSEVSNYAYVSIESEYKVFVIVLAVVVGVISGLFPSIKAANLDPIESLRDE